MIIFNISSGSMIGIGHVRRCVQLAEILRKRNLDTVFYLAPDPESIKFLDEAGVKYSVYSSYFSLQDFIRQYTSAKVIVLDLLDANGKYTSKIKAADPALKILALDFFDMYDENIDVIINLYNHSPFLKSPVSRSVKYLEGPGYGIVREEFKQFVGANKEPVDLTRKVLVTFGGSDPKKHTLTAIPILAVVREKTGCEISVVLGPNFSHRESVLKMLNQVLPTAEVFESPDNMAALMFRADLCICGSGTTILELASIGTPAVIIPQSDEELKFASVFVEAGFAVAAGGPDGIDSEVLEIALIELLSTPEMIARRGMRGRKLCDGFGADRIVDEIYGLTL